MCILSQNLGSISLHPSGPSKSFMCPALPKILCALGIDMLKKVDSKKNVTDCTTTDKKEHTQGFTDHTLFLTPWRRAPLGKVLKGFVAIYGTYGYQVIKRVTPVPILSHTDAIHTHSQNHCDMLHFLLVKLSHQTFFLLYFQHLQCLLCITQR
jgi:hypothetical protein